MEDLLKKISEIVFKDLDLNYQDVEKKYPPRSLPEGAMVTRIAPSPTGFMHIGGVYAALISERLAHQSKGVFYLRIEDTDKKRYVEGAVDLIKRSMKEFNILFDEGEDENGVEKGNYAPYTQSHRENIYKSFVKKLFDEGKAYLCFATPEELEEMSKKQSDLKLTTGYYGEWAIWRNKSAEETLSALNEGKSYVVRLKSPGNQENKTFIHDFIRGKLEFPENVNDIVLLKSNGLPTYHFAHVIDDHFMYTSHVIRGDEWLSSLPVHVQLFKMLGWEPPKYGHIAPIQKLEDNSRRKLSKRKDPEASVDYYMDNGIPAEAVKEYLLNLANSNFEDWRKENPSLKLEEFELDTHKFNNSGGLLDLVKMENISKNFIAFLSSEEVYNRTLKWSEKYDPEMAEKLKNNKVFCIGIFSIDRGIPDPRKDIAKWADVKNLTNFFFDDWFFSQDINYKEILGNTSIEDSIASMEKFSIKYPEINSKEEWLQTLKDMAVLKVKFCEIYLVKTKNFRRGVFQNVLFLDSPFNSPFSNAT
jgi:glutamyl-tRNA synthetase